MSSPARSLESPRASATNTVSNSHQLEPVETRTSGVSWAAVLAGASVTAAMSVTLMTLGAGVSLSSISPWPDGGASASRLAPIAIAWIILVQILSAGIGGYLAGRLRTKWVNLHTHEVYFRDTAHGFLAWAVGLILGVVFLAGMAKNVGPNQEGQLQASDYYVGKMFRSTRAETSVNDAAARREAAVILGHSVTLAETAAEDRADLAQLVVARTGMNRAEAEKRVDDTLAEARYAADNARKALAHSFYWLFVALLCGAFCGSLAATIGGRERDRVPAAYVPA
jgi:hypothetical protein